MGLPPEGYGFTLEEFHGNESFTPKDFQVLLLCPKEILNFYNKSYP